MRDNGCVRSMRVSMFMLVNESVCECMFKWKRGCVYECVRVCECVRVGVCVGGYVWV